MPNFTTLEKDSLKRYLLRKGEQKGLYGVDNSETGITQLDFTSVAKEIFTITLPL